METCRYSVSAVADSQLLYELNLGPRSEKVGHPALNILLVTGNASVINDTGELLQ